MYISRQYSKNLDVINRCIIAQNSVSGIVATSYYGSIINCYNTGTVIGNDTVSGIIAYGAGNVENCYNAGTISAAASTVGGVAGGNYGNVTKCYNSGNISGNYYVGGVVGMNDGTIDNCYNTGTVVGKGDSDGIGGVIGDNWLYAEKCYNIGDVSGSGNTGSIAGSSSEDILANCFYLLDNGIENGIGTAISKEQFANKDTFTNASWDFTSTWIIDDNWGRPILQTSPINIMRIASADYIKTSNGYEINTVLTQPADNMMIFAALYDKNGTMLAVGSSNAYDGTHHTVNIISDEPGTFIKVFLWNDMTNINPICDTKNTFIE
jgi:hypothetical protein